MALEQERARAFDAEDDAECEVGRGVAAPWETFYRFNAFHTTGMSGKGGMEGEGERNENVQVLDGECDSFSGECGHCHGLAYTEQSLATCPHPHPTGTRHKNVPYKKAAA